MDLVLRAYEGKKSKKDYFFLGINAQVIGAKPTPLNREPMTGKPDMINHVPRLMQSTVIKNAII